MYVYLTQSLKDLLIANNETKINDIYIPKVDSRSYVVYALDEGKNQLENLKKLKGLRSRRFWTHTPWRRP